MSDSSAEANRVEGDRLFQEAIRSVTAWGAAGRRVTGTWLNRRRLTIGVGLADGDEIETTEELRRLVQPPISIRTRVCSPQLAELWQLQDDVSNYLDDAHVWGRWAVRLGVNTRSDALEIGLLPDTPHDVPDQVRARFPNSPLVFVTALPARAV